MDRDTKLKEFAAALFSHVYREYNTTFDLPVKLPHVFSHHAPQDDSKEEAAAVLRLCLALRGVFNGIFVKSFESFQRSTQHFMTFLTSRCLKLCAGGDDDVFLSFCMVCAFVAELNLFCLINGCFAFMATAPKCLQAIFNRRLRKEFYASGGWESLRFFAVHFARDVSPEDVVSEGLLASIKDKLDEDSSEDDSSEEEEDNDEDEDNEDNEADNEEDNEDKAASVVVPPPPALTVPPVAANDSEDDSSDDSESDIDSDDSDSDDESEEEVASSRPNGLKRPREDTSEDSDGESEAEAKRLPIKLKPKVDSDDDSDSEEEEDTSSMSDEEEEETEDSESDAAPSTVQTNCIKPIMQENLNVDKKVL